ncbi:hypothetical protein WMY93_017966 [Mugilogobius chulae]|uniref:ALMS motif domain-containing protein n=1 Tax=Mugilogobius chulae TaxID=88201 RepID=A0AAW0NME8_9GOBI
MTAPAVSESVAVFGMDLDGILESSQEFLLRDDKVIIMSLGYLCGGLLQWVMDEIKRPTAFSRVSEVEEWYAGWRSVTFYSGDPATSTSSEPDSFLTSQDRNPPHNSLFVPLSTAKDIVASVHKNVMSWAVWRGHKEKKSVSFAAVTPAASPQSALASPRSAAPSLLRTRSVPDVMGPDPTLSNPPQNVSTTALDAVWIFHETSSIVKPNALRQTYSPSDRLAVRGPGRRKEQVVQSEKDRNLEGSPKRASNSTSFCSCIHFDIPPGPVLSVIILVKSLSISLEDFKTNPALHMSTLSCRLANFNVKKFKSANHRRASRCGESGDFSYRSGRQSKQKSHKCYPWIIDIQWTPYIKTNRQKGNADEEVQAAHNNFKPGYPQALGMMPFSSMPPVDAGPWDSQSSKKEEEPVDENGSTKPNGDASLNTYKTCYYHSRLKEDTVDGPAKSLSLQEALELFRPDFISRSQGRVKKLEQRARTRRAHCDSSPGLVHGLGEDRGRHRRNCTTPDPLSDNLFKPRERTISGREMQLRSRRIYNKLPEVTKRRQEEKRRAVSQTNRLRAEVYKKRDVYAEKGCCQSHTRHVSSCHIAISAECGLCVCARGPGAASHVALTDSDAWRGKLICLAREKGLTKDQPAELTVANCEHLS